MTDNSKKVFGYLKEHYGEKLTHQHIVAALGVSSPAVSGSVNGLVKKGLAVRTEETEMSGEDGKEVIVKYISLTEEGYAFDPDAEAEAKA
jgi:DNA-binding MarR family transcriptional regulator